MFNFVIVTTKVTPQTTKTIEVLLETKTVNDNIIVINYNNYDIKYRSTEGIDYRHVKQSRRAAINSNLPKDANVVLLGNQYIATNGLVGGLYKFYDYKCLSAIRVDNVSEDGKFVESDFRIGSKITPKSFNHLAIAFNTAILSSVGETPEETAIKAVSWDIPLDLLSNTRVLQNEVKKRKVSGIGVTILIPSLKYRFAHILKDVMRPNDKLYEFDSDPRALTKFVNKKIIESPNECILILNPDSKIVNTDMLNRIRGLFDGKSCIVFDSRDDIITDNCWLIVPKSKYAYSHKAFSCIKDLQKHVLSYNNSSVNTYLERLERKADRALESHPVSPGNMFSIIIPFMYNGDRWPLFNACIEKLYHCTKDHDNIEIIIHETAPKRYITPTYISQFELKYLFSEYHGLFHRAWNLNVVAKHMAKGSVFVFFDADLIIDYGWVEELLTCDRTIPHIGWGKMKNLTPQGTNTYIREGRLTESIIRTRHPSGHAAAAGINIIPRDIFFAVGGWPESYKDKGYGGEDNSLTFKMISLGMYDKNMKHW